MKSNLTRPFPWTAVLVIAAGVVLLVMLVAFGKAHTSRVDSEIPIPGQDLRVTLPAGSQWAVVGRLAGDGDPSMCRVTDASGRQVQQPSSRLENTGQRPAVVEVVWFRVDQTGEFAIHCGPSDLRLSHRVAVWPAYGLLLVVALLIAAVVRGIILFGRSRQRLDDQTGPIQPER